MTTTEAIFSKIKTCEAILKKCEGYGTNVAPLTMGVFIIKQKLLSLNNKYYSYDTRKNINL